MVLELTDHVLLSPDFAQEVYWHLLPTPLAQYVQLDPQNFWEHFLVLLQFGKGNLISEDVHFGFVAWTQSHALEKRLFGIAQFAVVAVNKW